MEACDGGDRVERRVPEGQPFEATANGRKPRVVPDRPAQEAPAQVHPHDAQSTVERGACVPAASHPGVQDPSPGGQRLPVSDDRWPGPTARGVEARRNRVPRTPHPAQMFDVHDRPTDGNEVSFYEPWVASTAMASNVAEPFDRELLVFVGKGGVGKTTIASAVALGLAASGRRTLLVTVDPAQRLADALGVPVGHRIQKVRGLLYATMLDPEKLLIDYLREFAPGEDLTRHPLYKYVSNYLPGLNELLGIGRLIEVRRENRFDSIVIDTAPTGHALSFLTTPLKVRDLLRESLVLRWAARGYAFYRTVQRGGRALQGWMGREERLPPLPEMDVEAVFEAISRHVGAVHELLQDSRRTAVSIVCLAERLPVQETLALDRYLRDELSISVARVFVNKFAPLATAEAGSAGARFAADARARAAVAEALASKGYPGALLDLWVEATEFAARRRGANEHHLAALGRALPDVPTTLVPLQPEDVHGLEALDALSRLILGRIGPGSPARRARPAAP